MSSTPNKPPQVRRAIAYVATLVAPLLFGLFGYHYLGPLGTAIGLIAGYYLWSRWVFKKPGR